MSSPIRHLYGTTVSGRLRHQLRDGGPLTWCGKQAPRPDDPALRLCMSCLDFYAAHRSLTDRTALRPRRGAKA